jgi:phage terminase large subunit
MFANYDKSILIKVDDTGVGGGVTDEMMRRGYNIMAINFGAKPKDKNKYPNLISEAWFYMAEIMPTIQLEMDSDLLMELSSRRWVMDNRGRRGVESKEAYKKRGYRSPDMADATILCFYTGRLLTSDDIFL